MNGLPGFMSCICPNFYLGRFTICYRTNSCFFNLWLLKAKTKFCEASISDFFFAGEYALTFHSEEDNLSLADCFFSASKAFQLSSFKKRDILLQSAPEKTKPAPGIRIDGLPLKNVEYFTYLCSRVSFSGSLDNKISCYIARASTLL